MAIDRPQAVAIARILAVTLLLSLSGMALKQAQAAESGGDGAAASGETAVPLVRGIPKAREIEEMLTRAIRPTHGVENKQPPKAASAPAVDLLVLFEFDSDELTPAARRQLDEVAAAMASDSLRDATILIQGHADAIGSAEYNQALSVARARAVVAYLSRKPGVDGTRLKYQGLGESQLRNPNDPGSAENRRVTFINVGG